MHLSRKIAEFDEFNQPYVLTTVVKTAGSVPGKVGFKMLVAANGETWGTVGGGEIEQRVKQEALQRLTSGESGLQEYVLTNKYTEEVTEEGIPVVPMMCSGKVWIFYEVHGQRPAVYLFGGGHVGQQLLYFLAPLNYHLVLIDNREEFASEAKNPYAHERFFSDYEEFARTFQPAPESYIVLMTQGHGWDYKVLRILFQRKLSLKYIGVIASKAKARELKKKLREEFGEQVDVEAIHAPIGLPIGGTSAAEIALSVAAELQSVHYEVNKT